MTVTRFDFDSATTQIDRVLATPDLLEEARALVTSLVAEVRRLRGVIERDRTKAAVILGDAQGALRRRGWLAEGRGAYVWDDDRWMDEFAVVMDELKTALDPMRVLARDWSDCPPTTAEVDEARVDWRAKALELEAELTKLKAA